VAVECGGGDHAPQRVLGPLVRVRAAHADGQKNGDANTRGADQRGNNECYLASNGHDACGNACHTTTPF
jgi:hypothetical protein